MPIYLYVKTHSKTGLKYLGKTTNPNPHLYTGSGRVWKCHMKKHGTEHTTEIIKECQTEEELKLWGIYYSRLWNVVEDPQWANLTEETGTGGRTVEHFKHSVESKEKIRKARIGKKASQETRKKISESKSGVSWGNHSEEAKEKIRQQRHSEEFKSNLSAQRLGDGNPMYGKTHTTDTKEKMSKAHLGKILSDETKEKMRQSKKGKKFTNEHKAKLKEARARWLASNR